VVVLLLVIAVGVTAYLLRPQHNEPETLSRVENPPEHVSRVEKRLETASKVDPPEQPKQEERLPAPKVTEAAPIKAVNLPAEGKSASRPSEVEYRPPPQPPGPSVAKDNHWNRVEVLVEHFPARCDRGAFSADGRYALAGNSKLLTHYTLSGSIKSKTIDPFLVSPTGLVTGGNTLGSIALAPDGSAVLWATIMTTEERVNDMVSLTAEYDTVVRDDFRNAKRFYGDTWSPGPGKSKPPTRCVGCSPDGKLLIAGSTFLRRWDLSVRQRVYDKRSAANIQLEDEALCLSCSPDGKLAVVGCRNRELYLYPLDRESETPLCEFKEHAASPRCVGFVGPDHIVSGDDSGQVCIWRVPSKGQEESVKPESTEAAHAQAVLCVAASTSSLYATGGADGLVRIGRVGSKGIVLSERFVDEVRALVFKAEDRQLLVLTSRQLVAIHVSPPPPEGVAKGN
jgi:hypothetical protein